MTWGVPLLIPGKGWHVEEIDANGVVISTRRATPDEQLEFCDDPAEAYEQRASFHLWENRRHARELEEVWPYQPGYWRGQPNKHAVKKRD